MKIAYVIPKFHPFKGGAEQNMLAMASRMARKGHDVTVHTTDAKFRDQPLAKEEEYRGIKIIRHAGFIQRPYYLNFVPGLLPALISNQYDAVHVSGFGYIWYEFCLVITKLLRPTTKFVNTPHGPFMANENETGYRKVMKNIYTPILATFLHWLYHKVIAVVPKQEEWLTGTYNIKPGQIEVVPNGIEITYLEERAAEFSKEDPVIITYLNRMEWYKGIQTVLSAISKLNRQEKYRAGRKDKEYESLPEYEFWVMGRPGGYSDTIKEIIDREGLHDQVRIILAPSDSERDEIFYTKSQINILPSKWEATGITLIEAMAKGNVIITTYQNQAHDLLIKEGKSGYVFDFGDVDALTEILRGVLENYELRQTIRKYNIGFAKGFTWETVFPKYERMLDVLTNPPGSK